MTDKPEFLDKLDESDQIELNRLILEKLAPISPIDEQESRLRQCIMDRIAKNINDHAGLMTVRLKHGVWQTLKPGIRFKSLWSGSEGNSVLIEFAAGASLPTHRHNFTEEGIVIDGDLEMGELKLGPLDYHMSPIGSQHNKISSRHGALAFLRGTSLGHKTQILQELFGGLLPFRDDNKSVTVFNTCHENWVELMEGVFVKYLWSDKDTASRLFRIEPGARVPGHTHLLDEECMMLEGEVFLGDILLRKGEYQIAQAGSRHGEFFSDVGGTLFVRGARDC